MWRRTCKLGKREVSAGLFTDASQALGPCPWCAAADQWPSLERMTTVESGRNEMTFWSSFFFSWNKWNAMNSWYGWRGTGLGLEVLVFSVETPLVSVPIIVQCESWIGWPLELPKGTSYKKEWRFLHFIGFAGRNFTSTQRRLWPIASFTWWTGQFATLFWCHVAFVPSSFYYFLVIINWEGAGPLSWRKEGKASYL